jgi:hypothetical protein
MWRWKPSAVVAMAGIVPGLASMSLLLDGPQASRGNLDSPQLLGKGALCN